MLDDVMTAETIEDANVASEAFRIAFPDDPCFLTFPMGTRGHVTVQGVGQPIVGITE